MYDGMSLIFHIQVHKESGCGISEHRNYSPQLPIQSLIVTVENPPVPFSPFSLVNCTMLSHFSFNDFIALAFLDLAGDLDIQI